MTSDIGFYGGGSGGRAGSSYQDADGNTVQVSEEHPLPVTIAGGVTVELPDDVEFNIDGSVISLTAGTEVGLIDGTVVGLAPGSIVKLDTSQLPLAVDIGSDPIDITGTVTLAGTSTVQLAAGTTVGLASGATVALATNTTVGLAAGATVALAANTSIKVTADSPLPVAFSGTPTVALATNTTVKVIADAPLDVTIGGGDPVEIALPTGETLPVSGTVSLGGPVTINDAVPVDVNLVSTAGPVEVALPDGEALEITGVVDLLSGAEVTVANTPTVHLASDAKVKVDDTTAVKVNVVSSSATSGTVDLADGAEVALVDGTTVELADGTTVALEPGTAVALASGTTVALAAGTKVGIDGSVALAGGTTVGLSGPVEIDDSTPLDVHIVSGAPTTVSLTAGTKVGLADGTQVTLAAGAAVALSGAVEIDDSTPIDVAVTGDVTIDDSTPLRVNIVSGGGGGTVSGTVDIADGAEIGLADGAEVALAPGSEVHLASGTTVGVTGGVSINGEVTINDTVPVDVRVTNPMSLTSGTSVGVSGAVEVKNVNGDTLDVTIDGPIGIAPGATVKVEKGTAPLDVNIVSGAGGGTASEVEITNDATNPVPVTLDEPIDVRIVSGGGGGGTAASGDILSTPDGQAQLVKLTDPTIVYVNALNGSGDPIPVRVSDNGELKVALASALDVHMEDGATVALAAGTTVALASGTTVHVDNLSGHTLDVTVDGAVALAANTTVGLAAGTAVKVTADTPLPVAVNGTVALAANTSVALAAGASVTLAAGATVALASGSNVGLTISGSAVSSSNPLPVAVQGTVPVSGTVGISGTVPVSGTVGISGTPNVAVTNTPAVTVSGTPNVAVTNTPAVTVSGTAQVNVVEGANWLSTPDGAAARVVVQNYAQFPSGSGGSSGTAINTANGTTGSGVTAAGLLGYDATNSVYRRVTTNPSGALQFSGPTLTVTGSTTASAGDTIASTDVTGYAQASIQITNSAATNRYRFEGSNDGTTWYALPAALYSGTGNPPTGQGGYNLDGTAANGYTALSGVFVVNVVSRYMRVRCTAFTGGSLAAVMTLSSAPSGNVTATPVTNRHTFTATSVGSVGAIDAVGMASVSVTITSNTAPSVYNWECSPDNSSWFAFPLTDTATGTIYTQVSDATARVYQGALPARYFRVRVLAVAGSTTGIIELSAAPIQQAVQRVAFASNPTVALASNVVDTELPAAAALSDALANPTTPMIGASGMVWDATNTVWIRQRTANSANATSGAGVNGAGLLGYDAANALFRRVLVDASGYLLTKPSSAASIGSGRVTVSTAGSRVQMSSSVISSIQFKAPVGNQGPVYIGGSGVSATSGIEMWPGDTLSLEISNCNLVWVDAAISGDSVAFIYLGG